MFRMSLLPSATVFYVEFSTTREARAFARAVGGTPILDRTVKRRPCNALT